MLNCGQVCGSVQIGFVRSIAPVIPQEIGNTRVTHMTEADAEGKNAPGTMGRKYVMLYPVDCIKLRATYWPTWPAG